MDKTIRIDETTFKILENLKEKTGISIKRLVKNAVELYSNRSNKN